MFAPNYSDPNAPSHKLPPPQPPKPKPAPSASSVAERPPPPPEIPPTRARPYGACEPGARDWVACLGGAAQLADQSVEQAEHGVLASLGSRPGVNPVLADAAARDLRAAGDAWRALRDRECAELSLIETGLTGSLYERRLVCRIRRDIERAEFLRDSYGAG